MTGEQTVTAEPTGVVVPVCLTYHPLFVTEHRRVAVVLYPREPNVQVITKGQLPCEPIFTAVFDLFALLSSCHLSVRFHHNLPCNVLCRRRLVSDIFCIDPSIASRFHLHVVRSNASVPRERLKLPLSSVERSSAGLCLKLWGPPQWRSH